MPSTTSSSKQRIVVAVDGGIHKTDEGMTGAAGIVIFRLRPVAPKSMRVPVESISVRGRYYKASKKKPVTNNRMELAGFLSGALILRNEVVDQQDGSIDIEFWSDSQYSLGVLFRPTWQPKKNIELIEYAKKSLDALTEHATVSGRFIRGHSNHFINEFADLVAALSIQRQKNIDHELLFKDIEDWCLFCDLFPCKPSDDGIFGRNHIKKWKERFEAMQNNPYGPPCVNRKKYDAEFTLRRTPVRVSQDEGASGGSCSANSGGLSDSS